MVYVINSKKCVILRNPGRSQGSCVGGQLNKNKKMQENMKKEADMNRENIINDIPQDVIDKLRNIKIGRPRGYSKSEYISI